MTQNLKNLACLIALVCVSNVSAAQYKVNVVDGRPAMTIRSEMELSDRQQGLFAWHYRNAEQLAEAFAKQEGLTVQRTGMPTQVMVFQSPEGVARATMQPRQDGLGEAVARINLNRGVVYLGRSTPEDLYVELGKWFFYETSYKWGQDRSADQQHLQLAERFAKFCMDKRNWTEANGSTEGQK